MEGSYCFRLMLRASGSMPTMPDKDSIPSPRCSDFHERTEYLPWRQPRGIQQGERHLVV